MEEKEQLVRARIDNIDENYMDKELDLDFKSGDFKKLMFLYNSALKQIETKLEIMKDEFKLLYDYDLIDHFKTRIKEPESILKKMKEHGYELTYKSMVENISDIAGIRVICMLKKDISLIENLIERFPDIKVIKKKDYVGNPKPSGYQSSHLIIEVPVILAKKIITVKVEIQIRTMAMDFWATLEHKLKYKNTYTISKKASKDLVECAKVLNKIDSKLMAISENTLP